MSKARFLTDNQTLRKKPRHEAEHDPRE